MNKDENVKSVFRTLTLKGGINLHDFKKCLVHISVYESKNQKNPGNSRYVFIGMYSFKGYLANLISSYVSGNGKQLQHYLGNIFSNERLSDVFDELKLEKCVSFKSGINLDKIKHIFSLAYLGFIHQHGEEKFLKETALKYFLNTTNHLLPKSNVLNQIQTLKIKAKQILDNKVKILQFEEKFENGILYITKIVTDLEEVIGEHESVSQTYAKKKAIKNALKFISAKQERSIEYQDFIIKKERVVNKEIAETKAEKNKIHIAFIEEKRLKREVEKEIKNKVAKEREIRRVLNKQNVKKRKPVESQK